MTLIDKAKDIRSKRSKKYGSPADNMAIFIDLFNAYFKTNLTPADGAIIGILMKLSRESHEHNEDNLLDIIGWADVKNECEQFKWTSPEKAKK